MQHTANTNVGNARVNGFDDFKTMTKENFAAITAILDAAEILIALEHAPAHHDTHPSHNIMTGGGFAHGRKLFNDTLPNLLSHAKDLVFDVKNEANGLIEVIERGQFRQ